MDNPLDIYLEPLIKRLCTPVIKSFSTAVPQLWNTIPEYVKNADSVTTFKTKLKTFLFRKYFH